MFKAIIVDDEEWTRLSLRKQANWEGLGILLAGEAKNGETAMKLVEEIMPDIVITDIRMPVMDGMKLMEQLNCDFPSTLIIVISGYSEFEYAKKALSLHAFDYILKPIETDPLMDTLRRAVAKLSLERENRDHAVRLRMTANESAALSKEKFLTHLVLGDFKHDEEIQRGLNKYGLLNYWTRMAVVVLVAENFDAVAASYYKQDKELTSFVLSNVINELVQDQLAAILFRNYSKQNELILILQLNTLDDQAGMDIIYTSCRLLKEAAERATRFRILIGIGREFTSLSDASLSYKQSSDAVQNAGILGLNTAIVHIDEISSRNEYMIYPGDKEKELLYYLENLYKVQAMELIENLFKEMSTNTVVHPQSIRDTVTGLVLGINKALSRHNTSLEVLLEDSNILEYVMGGFPTADKIKERLCVLVSRSADYLAEFKKRGSRKQIANIADFLNLHYQEDLSLNELADRWFLNPAYLSRIFKNETGVTFNEYLTKLRMEAAAKLLQDPRLKMSDISEMSGYPNEKYFFKKFKEYYDCTPTEYRNRK